MDLQEHTKEKKTRARTPEEKAQREQHQKLLGMTPGSEPWIWSLEAYMREEVEEEVEVAGG